MEKVIHQIWFQGRKNMPEKYQQWALQWQKLHPNWSYNLWDEYTLDTFINEHYPQYYKTYQSLDAVIKKCDMARYFLMHHFGGLYADADTCPIHSIDEFMKDHPKFFEDKIVFSRETNDFESWKNDIVCSLPDNPETKTLTKLLEHRPEKVVNNGIIFSHAQQSFWLDFIKLATKYKNDKVLLSFGTWRLSEFIINNLEHYSISIIHPKYFMSTTQHKGAYCLHKFDGNWFESSRDGENWFI